MFARRLALRHAARIALAAILLSIFPPAGAHHHGATAGGGAHADFCSTVGTNGPTPAAPVPMDRSHNVCTHCDGCTGNAGSAWALPAPVAPAIALGANPHAIIVFTLPAATPVDLIAAPPRGPPHFA